jgi:hypothetical protein
MHTRHGRGGDSARRRGSRRHRGRRLRHDALGGNDDWCGLRHDGRRRRRNGNRLRDRWGSAVRDRLGRAFRRGTRGNGPGHRRRRRHRSRDRRRRRHCGRRGRGCSGRRRSDGRVRRSSRRRGRLSGRGRGDLRRRRGRRRRRCRRGRGGHRGNRHRRSRPRLCRIDGRHSRDGVGSAWRQEPDRVDVALVLVCVPNSQLHVRPAHLGISAGTDRPDAVAFGNRRPLGDPDRSELGERDRPAVRGQDRHRLPTPRHGAGEGHDASGRGTNRFAGGASDVDAAVLAGGVGVHGVEREREQDGAARRPGPGRGRSDEREGSDKHEQESTHGDHLWLLSILITV